MNETSETGRENCGDMEVIYAYTREQAIEDGELVDLSALAREAGFKYPVAASRAVWALLEPSDELKAVGQDLTGRSWDMLNVLRWAIRKSETTDRVAFAPLFLMEPTGRAVPINLWAACGPDDNGEPVITIMRDGED